MRIIGSPFKGKGEFLTTAQISDVPVREGSIKRPMPLNRLGMILRRKGYQSVTRGARDCRIRGWLDISAVATK